MLNKTIILAISSLALICTSAYAKDPSIWKDRWRDSPLTSKTSNGWRKKPYVTTTTDNWRNLPQSARQSQSKLRWNKSTWEKSPTNWRNRPDVKKPVDSSKWENRWDKRKWRESPLNWRSSGLRYKNTVEKSEGRKASSKVKEWLPENTEMDKESVSEEKKEYVKPQMEKIDESAETKCEKASPNLGNADNHFVVYSGKTPSKIEKNAKKHVRLAPGGVIKIYSSVH